MTRTSEEWRRDKRRPRWPGKLWTAGAEIRVKAPQTFRPIRADGRDDLFASPLPRIGVLSGLWDRMWDESRHVFLVSTRRPDRLAKFVRKHASQRGFGWTDMGQAPIEPGDHASYEDIYYRNQCGWVGGDRDKDIDWACDHPSKSDRGEQDSCHECECPISSNVQDRKTLRKIGVADEYEYDDEGFTEDHSSWQEFHSRPRDGMAGNVWLGFRAKTREEFEAMARDFRPLRWHLGPYVTLFAEVPFAQPGRFGYYADSSPEASWSPEDRYKFGCGGDDWFVPYLDWIIEAGVPRLVPSWKNGMPVPDEIGVAS